MEDGLLDVIHQGQGFIRRTTLLLPNSKIITIMGSQAIGGSGARRVDTGQSAHGCFLQCEARRKAAHLIENRGEPAETSLPFAPASGAIQGCGTGGDDTWQPRAWG